MTQKKITAHYREIFSVFAAMALPGAAMLSAFSPVMAAPGAPMLATPAGPVSVAPPDEPPSTERQMDVHNYGVRGDGVTDDTLALQRAIAAITDAGGITFFPKGIYRVQAGGSPGIRVPDGAKLRGVGAASVIQAFDDPTASGNMFSTPRGQDSTVSFTDIAIEGPYRIPNELTIQSVYHQGTGGIMRFRRVKMYGRSVAIKAGGIERKPDKITVDIRNCDLSGKHCVLMPGTGTAYVRDTLFHDYGSDQPPKNHYHALYLYHGVTVDIENCRFQSQIPGSEGCAITMHNSLIDYPPGTPDPEIPRYARVVNCSFDASVPVGIKSNPMVRTWISGCNFANKSRSIVLQNDADIIKCKFSTAVYAISGYGGPKDSPGAAIFTSDILVQECDFAQTKGLFVDYNNKKSRWTFDHCTFAAPAGIVLPVPMTNTPESGGMRIINCRFSDSQDFGASTSANRPDPRRMGQGSTWYDTTLRSTVTSDGRQWRRQDGSPAN